MMQPMGPQIPVARLPSGLLKQFCSPIEGLDSLTFRRLGYHERNG